MFRLLKVIACMLLLIFMMEACMVSLPFNIGGETAEESMQEDAPEPVDEPVQVEEEATAEKVMPEKTATEEPPPVVEETQETPLPTPEHAVMPGDPILIDVQKVKDCYSGGSLETGELIIVGTGCDVWRLNYIERPFDPDRVDYDPNLDIIQQEFGYDDTFYFARLMVDMKEDSQPLLTNSYGVELDLDVDGDGDVLMYVTDPMTMEDGWTVERVFVWQDLNDDVGGMEAVIKDEIPPEGDGYETLYFESGYGEDADAAWARISPVYPSAIEFAFKKGLVEKEDSFMWWMWASTEPFDPPMFDYVDRFEEEDKYFIDESCRWIMFAPPNENLPNTCPVWKAAATPGVGACVCHMDRQLGLVCDCP